MDLTTLTPAELDTHRVAVLTECERRQRLASTPVEVERLRAQFIKDGGNPNELTAKR